MMQKIYTFVALNPLGQKSFGSLDAHTVQDVLTALEHHQLKLISARVSYWLTFLYWCNVSLSRQEVYLFSFDMAYLLRAGVSIKDSVHSLLRQKVSQKMKIILNRTSIYLNQGLNLSEALKMYVSDFGEFYISVIQIYEKSGCLDQGFFKILSYLKWKDALEKNLIKGLSYPILLLVVFFCLSVFYIESVVPIADDLHMSSETGNTFSSSVTFLWSYGPEILLGMILSWGLGRILFHQSPRFKLSCNYLFSLLPFIGKLHTHRALLIFSHQLEMLLKAQYPLEKSLEIVTKGTRNLWLQSRFNDIMKKIQGGSSFYKAMKHEHFIPKTYLRLIQTGEDSSSLTECLETARDYLEDRVKASGDRIALLLQPVMMVFIGMIMMMFVLHFILPLYDGISEWDF